jgi:DNA replication protein DnaC
MKAEPTWGDLMRFTGGKLDTMSNEEVSAAVKQCQKELEQRRLEIEWQYLCPPLYRDTSVERLPYKDKFNEVQNWGYGRVGLVVLGGSRRGKTRSVWKLLERLHFEGRTIIAFTPMDLKLQVATAWQEPAAAEEWLYKLRHTDVLFFDDLDTVKFTEAVEETIYDAFEWRPTHGKPVIVTINRSGCELAARMNAKGRGVKIVERMREYCEVINFA